MKGRVWAIGAAALLVVGVPATWFWMRPHSPPLARANSGPAVRTSLALPAELKLTIGRGASFIFNPDGNQIVFVASTNAPPQLYVSPIDRLDAKAIAGTDGASNPFFSPDGRWLGFFADGKLKKVSMQGGAPITLADAPAPRGHAWTADDDIILAPRDNTSLWHVPASGGRLEPFTTLADGDVSHRWPQALPGGTGVIYTVWSGTWEAAQLVLQPSDGSPRRVLVKGGGYGQIAGDGTRTFIVYAQPDIMAMPFDLERLSPAGAAIPVADGVLTNFSGGAQLAVSSTGSLAYISAPDDSDVERDLEWVTRDGHATPVAKLRGLGRWFDLSRDGTRIVRYKEESADNDVWIEDLANTTSTRIAKRRDPEAYRNSDRLNAIWSPDGKSVVFATGQPLNLWRSTNDEAHSERLTTNTNIQWPGSFSTDGRLLTYVETDPLSGSDIWILPLDVRGMPGTARPYLRTPFNESAPMISPDGHWLAYQSNESGRYEIYVQPFPGGGARTQISTGEGVYPRWSPKGDELFYRSGSSREGLVAVQVEGGTAFHARSQRTLFDSRGFDSIFAPSPDGSRFLMIPIRARDNVVTRITLITNWMNDPRRHGS